MICEARIVEYEKEDGKGFVNCKVQIYDYLYKIGKEWTNPTMATMPKWLYNKWGIMKKRKVYFNIMASGKGWPHIKFRKFAGEAPAKRWEEKPDANNFG